ncbi:MAG TPA: hypothetical protein VIG08_15540 [Gemmatimonadales bacterium]|jgi:hypothetical protein
MRGWWIPVALAVAACNDDNGSGPGTTPDAPTSLSSVSLDGAIALTWSDNSYIADPSNFQNYRVYSTTYNIDANPPVCGSSFRLEGTTVAPEFVVGALANGEPRCYTVTAVSVDGFESDRSPLRGDTPRPDARNVVVFARQTQTAGSGFRFWDDLNGDNQVQSTELGIVRDGTSGAIDFAVDRDGSGDLFLTPIRAGTGVEYYDDTNPVEDLTSVDFAPDQTYRTTPIQAVPGFGYVFEMSAADGSPRFGALRVTHVGQTFLIMDWAFQTDPGNPELVVSGKKMR